jgi:hypothetical protein
MFFLASCGWEKKLTLRQDNGEGRVEIEEPFPINGSGLRIVHESHGEKATLLEVRADTFLSFADAVWTQDGSTVAVFICRGGPDIRVAYDVKNHHPLAFTEAFKKMLANDIRNRYRPSNASGSDELVFRWACSEGQQPFLSRYPDAVAR